MQLTAHPTRGFLVECFLPGVEREDVEAAATRARTATSELRADGQAIEYMGAILLPADEVVLHLFRSDSSALVEAASERAHVQFERVTDAVTVDTCRTLPAASPRGDGRKPSDQAEPPR